MSSRLKSIIITIIVQLLILGLTLAGDERRQTALQLISEYIHQEQALVKFALISKFCHALVSDRLRLLRTLFNPELTDDDFAQNLEVVVEDAIRYPHLKFEIRQLFDTDTSAAYIARRLFTLRRHEYVHDLLKFLVHECGLDSVAEFLLGLSAYTISKLPWTMGQTDPPVFRHIADALGSDFLDDLLHRYSEFISSTSALQTDPDPVIDLRHQHRLQLRATIMSMDELRCDPAFRLRIGFPAELSTLNWAAMTSTDLVAILPYTVFAARSIDTTLRTLLNAGQHDLVAALFADRNASRTLLADTASLVMICQDAIICGRLDVLACLVRQPYTRHWINRDGALGLPPLHTAVQYGAIDAIRILLRVPGIDRTGPDLFGSSPLQYADGNVEIRCLLEDIGANPSI